MPQSNASGSDIGASWGFPPSGAGQKFQTPRRGVSRTAAGRRHNETQCSRFAFIRMARATEFTDAPSIGT